LKVTPDCIVCLVERAGYSCDLFLEGVPEKKATGIKARALTKVLKFFSKNINAESVPAFLGTVRERIIAEAAGVPDGYARIKSESNIAGRKLLRTARRWILSKKKKGRNELELALAISASGNSVEFGVRGHDFDLKSFEKHFLSILDESLSTTTNAFETRGIMNALKRHERVLFLTDNAGEIFLDIPLIEYLVALGKKVTVCPKAGPILNDATVSDVKKLKLTGIEGILPTGRFIGVFPKESDRAFLKEFWSAKNLIIAKGMGNYETISDIDYDPRLKGRVVYVFRAKCAPVARHAGVADKSFVARMAIGKNEKQ